MKRLRDVSESLLREHKGEIVERQFHQKRLADAVADIYAQIAVLSRVTSIFEEHGVEPSAQERYIAETFCTRAAGRVEVALDQIEQNDDERIVRDRQAGIQARRVRLRVLRGLRTRLKPPGTSGF